MYAKQLEFGLQKKRYGNQIWKWHITASNHESKEDVLKYCLGLKQADREKQQYLSDIRNTKGFSDIMPIVVGGFYTLTEIGANTLGDKIYEYTVEQEYFN